MRVHQNYLAMKVLTHIFGLLGIVLFTSCFSLSEIPDTEFSNEGLQAKEPISHIYLNVKRTAPLVSSYSKRDGLPEFHYKLNNLNENISVKTLVPTGLSEGYILPVLKIQTDKEAFEIQGELLGKELMLVGDEDNYNQYFTACSFEFAPETMDIIRSSSEITFILDTEHKERLFLRPFEKQLSRIKNM